MKKDSLRFWIPIAAFAIVNLFSQYFYVERNRAIVPGSFTEIPYASSTHLVAFLKGGTRTWAASVFTDSVNYVAARVQSYYVNPAAILYLSSDPYASFGPAADACPHPCLFPSHSQYVSIDRMSADRKKFFPTTGFHFYPGTNHSVDSFMYDTRTRDALLKPQSQLLQSVHESVLNGWSDPSQDPLSLYRVTTVGKTPNHLVFVPGSFGTAFGIGSHTSLYAIQPDEFYSNMYIAALGRYLLFRVLSPSSRSRFEISLTASLNADGKSRLPKAVIVGTQRQTLPLVGRGAARVFSERITPQAINGMRFVGLDVGSVETPITERPRANLMGLYGQNYRLDPRNITVYTRDISLVDDRRYLAMVAPVGLSHFPRDLANPNLEFSGLYEDGWASEDSYFVLQPPFKKASLRLRGFVPLINNRGFQTRMCVRLDRSGERCRLLSLGAFTVVYHLNATPARHKIHIGFDRYQVLPNSNRPVAMRLLSLGFEHN